MKRPISDSIYRQMCDSIPGGVNSPVRAFHGVGQLPLVAERGEGALVVDVDGHSYIDFCSSWGALLHGHSHPEIVSVAIDQIMRGSTFGITTAIEGRLANKIKEAMPSIEKLRFVSTGTEATMSAIRLARGYTKKSYIVKFVGHYHGHADFLLVKAGSGLANLNPESSSAGVPDEIVKHTLCIPFNDLESAKNVFYHPSYRGKIAAVILEPIAGNMGVVPAKKELMDLLVEETKKSGALLIFDEVMTGFRVGYGGAQKFYGVTPDLTCLAKIIGGGFPAAAFGGRAEVMNELAPLGAVYQAGTLSGNPVAMRAGLKALELAEKKGFYEELERKVKRFTTPLKHFLEEHNLNACVQEAGSMVTLFFGRKKVESMEEAKKCDQEKFARYFRYMFEKGVYLPPSQFEAWFISAAHTDEHMETALKHTIEFLKNP